MTLRCDVCHKPLKEKRYTIQGTIYSPNSVLVVGPDCFRAEKKARKEALARETPEHIAMMIAKVAAHRANQ